MNDLSFRDYEGKEGDYIVVEVNRNRFEGEMAYRAKDELEDYFQNFANSLKRGCFDARLVEHFDRAGLLTIFSFRRVSLYSNKKSLCY